MKFYLLLVLFIAGVVAVFVLQNQADIPIKFINWEFKALLPVILGVPFIIGILAGAGMFVPLWLKKGSAVKAHKKRIEQLETELADIAERARTKEPEAVPVKPDGSEEGSS